MNPIASLFTAVSDLWARAKPFLRAHIEMVFIIPALVALLVGVAYYQWFHGLPTIEWNALLFDGLRGLVVVSLLGYLAWRFKAEYWHDLDPEDERRLHDEAAEGSKWALWVIIKDRVEWLVLFGVLLFAYSSFAGASNPHTRDLLVRWEVTSQQVYDARYQRPIWPRGQSGITWGVGYDGGHQSALTIQREWAAHPASHRLSTTAGLTGAAARDALPRYRDIIVTWAQAIHVLDAYSIPRYEALARQAYGRHFFEQSLEVRAALTSETYNRGPGMSGPRRVERRHIRDVCLPSRDAQCVAEQLELSCRVWADDPVNGPGLCNRRRAEAAIALRGR